MDIETKMLDGQPMISIIGLGDQAVKEAAERIQAAIDESGYVFPKKRVIISLAPSDKKKSGSHFDLAMAVGVLCQNGNRRITAKWRYWCEKYRGLWVYRRIIIKWAAASVQRNSSDDHSRAEKRNS